MKSTFAIFIAIAGLCCLCFPGLGGAEEKQFTDKDRSWWAIQPVRDPAVPSGIPGLQVVDAFVESRREESQLSAAPTAGPEEFVRRAYFDLHGLPPTPEQVDTFCGDWEEDEDRAVAALVDQLLASPRYGERWAQHWLDVVRYAESDGYREDAFRPEAYHYRDYVVRSLNEDKPYDQFVREQLAADEFAPDDPETLVATGFLRLGIYEWNQRNAEMQRELMVNEITNLTGEVFLGVGIGCARCHDHKFDPLLQRDYFALQAFLSSTAWPTDRKLGTPEELAVYSAWEESTSEIRTEMDALLADARKHAREKHVKSFPENVQAMYWKQEGERSSYEQQIAMLVQRQVDREEGNVDAAKTLAKDETKAARYREVKKQLVELEKSKPSLPNAFISTDTGTKPATTWMGSGKKKVEVEPAFLALLGKEKPEFQSGSATTGRRTALANWIASTENPFAARVFVNRIWQHHFGNGLVATPNDFGTLGEPPSHPDMLDWLATRFVEGGWKMKPIHRLIMTSTTYRQTARREPGEAENLTDPGNRLLWRFPPARLSAEQVRDAMLSVSGELRHRDDGGASVDGGEPLRSLYVKKRRNTPEEMLQGFDSPAGFDSAPERQRTTTPTQALLLVNNDWPLARARAFARRLLKGKTRVEAGDIAEAYRLAWGREPSGGEIHMAEAFVAAQQTEHQKRRPPAPVAKFPKETGLRPIAQNFQKVTGTELGSRALWLQPTSRFEQLEVPAPGIKSDTFTIEAVAQLDSIHKDASVNTLVSRWNGNQSSSGWTLGVTSAKSRYEPRNFILQLTGANPGGGTEYEVVASNLRVPTGKPVYLAAEIHCGSGVKGKVRFFLKDLSDPDAKLQTVEVSHNFVGSLQNADTRLLIGGRDEKKNAHLWDGQLGKLTISPDPIDPEKMFGTANQWLNARFAGENGKEPIPGAKWLKKPLPPRAKTNPALDAMADFCHALLSSNEFLYLH